MGVIGSYFLLRVIRQAAEFGMVHSVRKKIGRPYSSEFQLILVSYLLLSSIIIVIN